MTSAQMPEPRSKPPAGDGDGVEVGARLREARAKIGMTRRQLAVASGTSERYLAHLEAGTGNPTLTVLGVLANALGMAVADLIPMGGERSAVNAEAAALLRRLPETQIVAAIDAMSRLHAGGTSRGRRIVLVGLRGAGKSSLGKALGSRLDLPFLEMSREVEKAYGGEMGLLIEIGGQTALRRYEHQTWETMIAQNAAVIATPGGIVADPVLYDRVLATAHSIWLEATPEDHMGRVMSQGDFRPMAASKAAMSDLKAILAARSKEYARAEARLDTSAQGFEATADRLEAIAHRLIDQHVI
jgi:XRE family transcriptional regulator, aerobic/anaerobic benzoate catabolism transcriptional regulator